MDDNTRAVLEAAIQVLGTLLAVLLGFATGLIVERSRRRYEGRHRFTDGKRDLYIRVLTLNDLLESDPPGELTGVTKAEIKAVAVQMKLFAPDAVLNALSKWADEIPDDDKMTPEARDRLLAESVPLIVAMRRDLGVPE
jgi:hypothetical protein